MYNYFIELAKEYNMQLASVLSIALNKYGIISDTIKDNRIRFKIKFNGSEKDKFFAVCVNTFLESPFKLEGNQLYLDDMLIGELTHIEEDTCTETYFRNDNKSITFNSNSRSKCVGCKFCGTYNLTSLDDYKFKSANDVSNFFINLLAENNTDINNLENVTICTGCFKNEDELVEHLLMVNQGLVDIGFNGSISYIGSQLRSHEKIIEIKKNIKNFKLLLTLEIFENREKFMKPEKASLTLDEAHDLLAFVSGLGMEATFLYILGLEDLDTVRKYFNYFKDCINKFPTVQVFQDYTKEQEKYRHETAKDINYYLEARKMITEIFSDTDMEHHNWESYRSLCYDKKKVRKLDEGTTY